MSNNNYPYIVADIGGTNARFGLVTCYDADKQLFTIEQQTTFPTADYPNFDAVLAAYIEQINTQVSQACIAVAGPVSGDEFKMTNLSWSFSRSDIKKRFNLEQFEVINDFAAQACALPYLQPEDLIDIKSGERDEFGTRGIIGPGTGLGVGSLTYHNGQWVPVAGEGGHVAFCPVTDIELSVLAHLQSQQPYISAETLLCGSGLSTLHKALSDIKEDNSVDLSPADITERAKQGDTLCLSVLNIFFHQLGVIAGNLALTNGTTGGIYLAGGILPRIPELLKQSDFIHGFENKGAMADYNGRIPVSLITHPYPALIGSAAWLAQVSRKE
ncbi:glucokinase [Maricurvus nonylphenolicus]|uniref:glucokinase n=1 Tax=Maricurvus nonylphenolicus TaxID=1008307 RepID=UPI0036F3A0BE